MAVKTITITEQAYNSLKWIKKENESFSELFLRISKKPITTKQITGILNRTPEESEKNIKEFWTNRKQLSEAIKKRRENARTRL
jgi:predicted CopG family antitoxin